MHFVYRTKQLILILGDLGSFLIGLWIALYFRTLTIPDTERYLDHIPVFTALFLLWIIVNFINGLFDLEKVRHTFVFYKTMTETAIFSFIVGIIFFYFIQINFFTPKTILLLTILFGYSFSLLWRIIYIHAFGKNKLQTKILFVGYTQEIEELLNIMADEPERGYKCVSIICSENQIKPKEYKDIEIYNSIKKIRPAINNHSIDMVVISSHLRQNEEALRELYELLFWSVQIVDLSSLYEMITGRISPTTFSDSWFLEHLKNRERPAYSALRRLFDYVSSIFLLIILVILLPFVAMAIKINSRGPIFYKQNRIGEKGKEIKLYKFRSMYSLSPDGGAETSGVQFAKKGDERITVVGNFLRKSRLDELPQTINLFKGDVTLIGPRPERPEIVLKLESKMPHYRLRHIIKPGLTGWAQINQHYTDSMETSLQKLQYDFFYIKNRSLLLDLSIILKTINVIFRMKGQ